eukprot:1159756-Pelagomonas_calceolata.AAC.12
MQVTREVWSGATNNKKMTILIVPKTLWCSRSWLGFLWVETLLVHHCQSPGQALCMVWFNSKIMTWSCCLVMHTGLRKCTNGCTVSALYLDGCVVASDLIMGEKLGDGASGEVSRASLSREGAEGGQQAVAVKTFRYIFFQPSFGQVCAASCSCHHHIDGTALQRTLSTALAPVTLGQDGAKVRAMRYGQWFSPFTKVHLSGFISNFNLKLADSTWTWTSRSVTLGNLLRLSHIREKVTEAAVYLLWSRAITKTTQAGRGLGLCAKFLPFTPAFHGSTPLPALSC